MLLFSKIENGLGVTAGASFAFLRRTVTQRGTRPCGAAIIRDGHFQNELRGCLIIQCRGVVDRQCPGRGIDGESCCPYYHR